METVTVAVSKDQLSRGAGLFGGLRVAERIVLAFFFLAALASLLHPLSLRDRLLVWALNLAVAGVLLLLGRFGHQDRSEFMAALRGWLPCVLIIAAYRESGLFLSPDPNHHLDYLFIRWDHVVLECHTFRSLVAFCSPWIERYMELAYLLTYPFIPAGFGAIYWAGRKSNTGPYDAAKRADRFWTTVLLAVLTSYALYPFFPLTPPRVLFHDLPGPAVEPLLRQMNFWVLERYSVQACIFPSGHVAGAVATALAVRADRPRLGVLFLIAAASIAASTVFGRYHYSADAVAGALVGVGAYALATRIHKPSVQPREKSN